MRDRAAGCGGRLTARAWAWGITVEAGHRGVLAALATPWRPGRPRAGRRGSSAAESRAASTAYGFRTPSVLAPVNPASPCGVQPSSRAAGTAVAAATVADDARSALLADLPGRVAGAFPAARPGSPAARCSAGC